MRRRDATAVGVAGMALGNIHLCFTWQAWCSRPTCTCVTNLSSYHLLTHNLSSHNLLWRGRCGTYGTGLALVARLVLGVAPGRRGCWRGRRGVCRHPSSFYVAGVVLGNIDWTCTSAVSLIFLRILWHFWSGWDYHTCIICNHLTPYIYICIHTSIHPSVYPFIYPSIYPYIHACIHTCIHYNLSIHNLLVLTLPHTHNLLHTNPSPSLFPFLLSPCHLYLSFAACWKKLICGVIRFFNFDNYI